MNGIVAAARRAAFLAPAAAALVLLVTSSAGAAASYRDPTGDNGAAPDISNVAVTNDASGTITFDIGIVNLPSPADVQTSLFLDTDKNEATGAPGFAGADYAFVVDESDTSYGFYRWNGSDWDDASPSATVHVFSGTTNVRIVVNKSELGGVGSGAFNFWARTEAGDAVDEAPDDGTWSYTLTAARPTIVGIVFNLKGPVSPKAGHTYTERPTGVILSTDTAIGSGHKPDRYTCRATLGGKAIVGTGVGRCTWKLPATAHGRILAITLTVYYGGASKSFPSSSRVA